MSCCDGDEGGMNGCTCGQRALERGRQMTGDQYGDFLRWANKQGTNLFAYSSLGIMLKTYEDQKKCEEEKKLETNGKTIVDMIDALVETRIAEHSSTSWHEVKQARERAEKIKEIITTKYVAYPRSHKL